MSFATILTPKSGILAAYSDPRELSNALGLYFIVWFMFTVMLMCVFIAFLFSYWSDDFIFFPYDLSLSFSQLPNNELTYILSPISPAVVRRNFSLTLLLSLLAIAFIVLAVGEFQHNSSLVNFNLSSFDHLPTESHLLIYLYPIVSPGEQEL